MKFTWGHGIIVFFAIFLAWIISFVIFTLGQNHDLVAKDYYRQGAEYSKHMEVHQRSMALKDSIEIVNTSQGVAISFAPSLLTNTSEKDIFFYRPADKQDDIKLKIDATQPSVIVPNDMLKKGRYKISVWWKTDNVSYKIEKDFNVKIE